MVYGILVENFMEILVVLDFECGYREEPKRTSQLAAVHFEPSFLTLKVALNIANIV